MRSPAASLPPQISRRRLLTQALAGAGLLAGLPLYAETLSIQDRSRLSSVRVARVIAPTSVPEVVAAIRSWPGQIAIGGARYSMGGQTAIEGGMQLDLRGLKGLIWFDASRRAVRVQAGMRWRDLQDVLDPAGLAVHTMQSYANFSIGGSVSVNAHGRYVGHGPVGHSVRALQLVLADGRVVETCRLRNADLFRAAIGGYGAMGVITEVELDLDVNTLVERSVAHMPFAAYPGWFAQEVLARGDCVLHNADLLPPTFEQATAVSWRLTQEPATIPGRLVPRGRGYDLERKVLWAVSELPNGVKLQRDLVRPALLRGPAVAWRNREASLDAASLEAMGSEASAFALQEYFVPVRHATRFAREISTILQRHESRVLNVSVRHSPGDRDSVMAWAREEVFSFVLFHKLKLDTQAQQKVAGWSRELIDAALALGGSYYLPYQRHATQAQFDAAYPRKQQFLRLKARVDPQRRFDNELWRQYL